jgi:Ca-activated chloride channel family protein
VSRERLIVVAIAVGLLAALVVISGGASDDGKAPGQAPAGAIEIPFVYSPEKEDLLTPLIDDFNNSGVQVGGEPVFVKGTVVASGDAEQKIRAGTLRPVAWSPASSLWGQLLNYEADEPLAPRNAPSLVRTPLVIAMWEPMARALGWPQKSIGLDDILALARSKGGWAALGHPEFGDFKLVHTNPDFSTSGLEAVVAEYYAATGKRTDLTGGDIAGATREAVRDIERSIVHYGDTTLFIADQMREGGPSYASAAAMEETTLLDFNRDRGGQPKLVAIYPKGGTFYSDNPFFILDSRYVTQDERAGAAAFQSFLADKITPELAARYGFRPADLSARPVAPITKQNGVDPRQPTKTLSLPTPRVLAKVREAWRQDRKPANVMLVVDVSGSMAHETRMPRAKAGLAAFLDQIQPDDNIGLTAFDDRVDQLVPVGAFSRNRATLKRTIRGLQPDGGTAFLDATSQSFRAVQKSAGRNNRINAVVVLTDGADVSSRITLDRLTKELASQGDSASQVRVFTIGFSPDAEGAAEALKAIAAAGGGQYYEGNTEDIALVYRSISSFF